MKELKYNSIQDLSALGRKGISTAKFNKLEFLSTCKTTKILFGKATTFHDAGDDEIAYVYLLRIVNLYESLKASLEAIKPLSPKVSDAWKACGQILLNALGLAEVLKPDLVKRYEEAIARKAKLAELEKKLDDLEDVTQNTGTEPAHIAGKQVDGVDAVQSSDNKVDIDGEPLPTPPGQSEMHSDEKTGMRNNNATHVVGTGEDVLSAFRVDANGPDTCNTMNGQLLVPADVSGKVDEDTGSQVSIGYGGCVVIDPKELYRMITSDIGFLLIDLRSSEEYKNSHVDYANRIHVPPNILTSGMIVQNIEDKLRKRQYKRRLQARDENEYVVLIGADVSASGKSSAFSVEYQIIIDAMTTYEGHKRLKRAVRCVDGGFQNFYDYYPSQCSGQPLLPDKKRAKILTTMPDFNPVTAYPKAPRINPEIDTVDDEHVDDVRTPSAQTAAQITKATASNTNTLQPRIKQPHYPTQQDYPTQKPGFRPDHALQPPPLKRPLLDAQHFLPEQHSVGDIHEQRDHLQPQDSVRRPSVDEQPLVDLSNDGAHGMNGSNAWRAHERDDQQPLTHHQDGDQLHSRPAAPGGEFQSHQTTASTASTQHHQTAMPQANSTASRSTPAKNTAPDSFPTSSVHMSDPRVANHALYSSTATPAPVDTVETVPSPTVYPGSVGTLRRTPPSPPDVTPPVRAPPVPSAQEEPMSVTVPAGVPSQHVSQQPQRPADRINHDAIAADTPTTARDCPTSLLPRSVPRSGHGSNVPLVARVGADTWQSTTATSSAESVAVPRGYQRSGHGAQPADGAMHNTVLPSMVPSQTGVCTVTPPPPSGSQAVQDRSRHMVQPPENGSATPFQSRDHAHVHAPRSKGVPQRAPPAPSMSRTALGRTTSSNSSPQNNGASTAARSAPRRAVLGDVSARVGNNTANPPSAHTQHAPPRKPPPARAMGHRAAGMPSFDRTSKPESAGRLSQSFRAARMASLEPVNGSNGRALVGLRNLGNTCFMNSILQCLVAAAPLAKYFVQGRYRNDINRKNVLGFKGEVAEEFGELATIMWTRPYRYVHPRFFKSVISEANAQFAGYKQQDSQEFLAFLLDALHEDLNRVKSRAYVEAPDNTGVPDAKAAARAWDLHRRRNQSIIVDYFQGQFKSTLTCRSCGTTSVTFEPFGVLSLPISHRGSTTLQDCMREFSRTEVVTGADRWHCSKCKVPRDATKCICIWKLPKILIIHLKRFYFEGPFRSKIDTLVKFPMGNLNMAEHCKGTATGSSQYNLFAVSNHFGNLEGGHYTAYCKNVFDHMWYDFNDSTVTRTNGPICTKESYVLMYSSLDFDDYTDLFG
eukprot:m.910458 g.910458  ORF g.910458 m.910458 type:complete len:1322 (+) comp23723_c0_seq3:81-4046(+)